MTSTLKVDQIQNAAGGVPTAADLGLNVSGSYQQIVYTTSTTNLNISSTSIKYEIASVSITPKFSNSKLKVSLHTDFQQNSGNDAHIWLSRDDGAGIYNAITDGAWSTTPSNDQAMWQYFYWGGGSNAVKNAEQVFVVDAKTTSTITFKAWVGVVSGSVNIGGNNPRQQLIVEEIAG